MATEKGKEYSQGSAVRTDLGASATTTFMAFASPVSLKLPNGQPIGDHTWVATDVTDVCWACLGGSTEQFYCGSNRWSGGKYAPPGHIQSTPLPETGTGTIAAATCMGDPKRTHFMGIPSSAGIVYAVSGVCHQIANRALYFSGATVKGAKGYDASQILYGTYGTFVPLGILCPWSPPLCAAALMFEGGVLIDWLARTGNCKSQSLQKDAPTSTLVARVTELHESVREHAPETRAQRVEHHLREVDLIFKDRLGKDCDQAKVEQVKQLFRDREAALPKRTERPSTEPNVEYDAMELAMQLSDSISAFFNQIAEILGEDTYRKMFDVEPSEYVSIVNPSILDPTLSDKE